MPIERLSLDEIQQQLQTLNHWHLDADQVSLHQEWQFDSFKTALQFLLKVGEMAERHDHHPEFLSRYTRLRIQLSTHDAGGLTQKDFALAWEIDQLLKNEFAHHLSTHR